MKFKIIVVAAFVLCLSASMASADLTINPAPAGEVSLWTVVNTMLGLPADTITQAKLQALNNLETLPGGTYTVTNLARYAGFSQTLGFYTDLSDGTGKTALATPSANLTDVALTPAVEFTSAGAFGFYEDLTGSGHGFKYTQASLDSPATSQPNGLILDLSKITGLNLTGYIVAFEDGGNNPPLGDKDCNDMVARVNSVAAPLPGAVLLLGAGLARLAAYARRKRA